MVFRTLMLSAKRVPLIRFRKGGHSYGATGSAATSNQASSQNPAAVNKAASSSSAIEDWELPPRYWRKTIDKDEMEYINRGGPA